MPLLQFRRAIVLIGATLSVVSPVVAQRFEEAPRREAPPKSVTPFETTLQNAIDEEGDALDHLLLLATLDNLSADQLRRAVNAALLKQAMANRDTWDRRWGDLVEAALLRGELSNRQLSDYVKHGLYHNNRIRARYLEGDHLFIRMMDFALFFGGRTPCTIGVEHTAPDVLLNGEPPKDVFRPGETSGWRDIRSVAIGYDLVVRDPLPPGRHTLTLRYDRRVRNDQPKGYAPDDPEPEAIIGRAVYELQFDIEIVPRDMPVVRLITDPELEPAMQEAAQGLRFLVRPNPDDPAAPLVSITDQHGPPLMPVPLGGHIFVRDAAGNEHRLGIVLSPASRRGTWSANRVALPRLPADLETLTLIYRPNRSLTRWNTDFTEIYGLELVIEGVPIIRGEEVEN